MNNLAQLGFDSMNPKFVIDKPVRLVELFAGIGSQAKALKKLGVDFEHYRICEFDKFAVQSYNAIHHTDFKPSDITKINAADLAITNTSEYCYIMTYSFPCQDLSLAGKRNGMTKGTGTRSGLLWEVERLLNECIEFPQVLVMENVTQVHSEKNIDDFRLWQQFLESKGYTNFVADLNAKNYGVPQNRNRCFMVSLLGDFSYMFPLPIPLTKRLKDVLEPVVDDKYYLSEKGIKYVTDPERMKNNFTNINADVAIPITAKGQSNWTGSFVADKCKVQELGYVEKGSGKHQSNTVYDSNGIGMCLSATDYKHKPLVAIDEEIIGSTQKNAYRGSADGVCPTLTTAMGEGGGQIPMIKQIAQIYPNSGNPQAGRIYDSEGISPAIDTAQGGNRMPKIVCDDIKIVGNYSPSGHDASRIVDTVGIAPAVRENHGTVTAIIDEPFIVASRGRNPDNPKDRHSGLPTEQMLEAKMDGTSNCLTSVQKDNLVAEPKIVQYPRGYNPGWEYEMCPTLSSNSWQTNNFLSHQCQIRKLTPLECLRLMAFDDVDYKNIKAAGISDTQIYKQAGNSIVVEVMMAIFKEMI